MMPSSMRPSPANGRVHLALNCHANALSGVTWLSQVGMEGWLYIITRAERVRSAHKGQLPEREERYVCRGVHGSQGLLSGALRLLAAQQIDER